ncbi:MAG TPA: hypothetical protein VNQ79_15955 [Blastocatellia bacterium]|nr:hypothetical protein [Blastocatellia bacterium]
MTLLLKPGSGRNIILRDQSQPAFYPPATVAPVAADIYVHYSDEPPSAARFVRSYGPGEKVTIPHNPATDRNLVVRAVARSAQGTAEVSELHDASAFTVLFQREASAPSVVQIGASTQGAIKLSVTGFTQYARARRVRIADDAAMTVNVRVDVIEYGVGLVPTVYQLQRQTSAGQSAQTVYVRISHSSAGVNGPWSPESPAEAFTFADSTGSGGTTGDGSDVPRDSYEIA